MRLVGEQLGLPPTMVWRQPFPGPGLGIRIIGEVTRERLDILRQADLIAREELTAAGLDRDIWQFPVVLLADVRSVGVQGDGRTYGHPIVLRPVTSEDAMTADWARLPFDLLEKISTRITNEVAEVNRVTLDITSKPPGHHRVGVSRVPHPQVRLVPATVPLLNALNEDRARFGELIGSPVPDGWPEFPEAIGFTLEHLRTAPEPDRSWSMQFFVDHATGRLLRLRWLRHPAGRAHCRDRLRSRS